MYHNFKEIVAKAKEIGPRKVAVLFPDDPEIIRAMADGMKQGLITPVLVGNRARIEAAGHGANRSFHNMEIVAHEDPQGAADLCMDMVVKGLVSLVIKGNILTTYLYRALIRKTRQLTPDQITCTISFHQVPAIEKIFMLTDAGVNICPDLTTKQKILTNAINIARCLGHERPRVMVLSADHLVGSESISARDVFEINRLAHQGEFGECEILTACNLCQAFPNRIMRTEAFPDVFLVPNLETGNLLAKAIQHFGLGLFQGITTGAGIIALTPSRSAGYEVRLTNLALGVMLAAPAEEDMA